MAYKYSKKSTARKGKARTRRYAGKTYTKSQPPLDKLVDARVKSALSLARRGPPRSVTVRGIPCEVNRASSNPEFKAMSNNEWPAYLKGPLAERKYAFFPISELVPSQRGVKAGPDDGQRKLDSVFIKAVCARFIIVHAEGVRFMCFAFKNGNRRDCPPSVISRPFEVVEDSKEVPREVKYEVLTKDQLNCCVDMSEAENSVRHVGTHDGPFVVRYDQTGELIWKSVDGTAFTSRMSKEDGKPFGKIDVRVDNSPTKSCGTVCNMNMPTSSLMRTFTTPGARGIGSDWVGLRHRHVEVYITLNQRERYQSADESCSTNERPIELFVGFDGPEPFEIHAADKNSACGTINAMEMEVYYE